MKKSMLFTRIVSTTFLSVLCLISGVQAANPVAGKSSVKVHSPEFEVLGAVVQDFLVRNPNASAESAALEDAKKFALEVVDEFRLVPTSKVLVAHNVSDCSGNRVDKLDGDTLLLLAKTYEYFLVIAGKRSMSVLGVGTLDQLKAAYLSFKPLSEKATEEERIVHMTALGDIFTIVVKRLMEKKILTCYEGSESAKTVDEFGSELGVATMKPHRYSVRKLLDPLHRIFETLVNFLPLMLMASMQQALVSFAGANTTAVVMAIAPLAMIANTFLLGNVKALRCLVDYNPIGLVIGTVMRFIREGGHKVIDKTTAGKSTERLDKLEKAVKILAVCYVVWRHGSTVCFGVTKAVGAAYKGVASVYAHLANGLAAACSVFSSMRNLVVAAT